MKRTPPMNEPLVPSQVGLSDVVSVLNRYLAGDLTAGEVEAWANAVQESDAVAPGRNTSAPLRSVLNDLAHPEVVGPIFPVKARRWVSRLDAVGRLLADDGAW